MNASSKQEFARTGELDRSSSDKIAPNPVVMANDVDCVEVGAVTQSMPVSNYHNVEMVCDS
jgi:hypothetical protein